jgi:hypothetical protein
MSSSTKTIPILDSLRPYFRALIASGKYTHPVTYDYSSFILESESVASLIINKCHGQKYTDKDIAPEFLLALIEFTEQVKKVDNRLTANSPIGLMEKVPHDVTQSQQFQFGNFTDGGVIYTVLQDVFNKLRNDTKLVKFTDYKNAKPDMFDGEVTINHTDDTISSPNIKFSDDWVNKNIVSEIKNKVNKIDVFVNTTECSEFLSRINSLNWGNLSPPLEESDIEETDLYNTPNDKNSVIIQLLQAVFINLVKWIKNVGRKCFDIPHYNYSNSSDVRTLIDFLNNNDIEPEESSIFFTIFEVLGSPIRQPIGWAGKALELLGSIKSIDDLKTYFRKGGNTDNIRINLRLSDRSTSVGLKSPIRLPVIESWLPDLPTGGKIYVNESITVDDLTHFTQDIFYMLSESYHLMDADEDDELQRYRQYINDIKAYGRTKNLDSKTVLQQCMSTPTGQSTAVGFIKTNTSRSSVSNTNTGLPPPPPSVSNTNTGLPPPPVQPRILGSNGVPPPPPPPVQPRILGSNGVPPPPSGPKPLGVQMGEFLYKDSTPSSNVDRYLEVLKFDTNDMDDLRMLSAYKNGWTWNGTTWSKKLGTTTIEFDPKKTNDAVLSQFIDTQCEAIGQSGATKCTQILEKILSDNIDGKALNDLLTQNNFDATTGDLTSIHPKLAKKVLKNFGFKEVQFTTSLGTSYKMIEPVDHWISRFVCTKSELKDSCALLRSAKGKNLRLFLKLLVKAVNEDKRYNTSLSTSSSRVVDTAAEKAEQERLYREYGLPIYEYTGTPTTSTISLEEIKRGYGPKMDSIYGLRFDGGLNLMGSPLDISTASMLPFLMLSTQGLGRVPGFRVNLNKPLSFMSTGGMVGGTSVTDVFTNEELDVSTGFDLKSNEIKSIWTDLRAKIGELSSKLEPGYEQKIDNIVNDLIQKEASLLNNLSRIQKLKQLLDADPSLLSSGTGDSGAFKPEDVKKVADTFNTKMDEYRKSFNRASNILERLNGQTLMGVFKYTDIDV